MLGIRSMKPLPVEIPLALGDAIHCLRSALDYVASAIVGRHDKRITFPMHESRDQLEASFRTTPVLVGKKMIKKGTNAAIEEAIPGIGAFITDEIKSYKAPNGFIWVVGHLDNTDKHRLLLTLVVPKRILNVYAVHSNGGAIVDCTFGYDGIGFAPMVTFGPGEVKIHSHGKAVAEILFNEAEVITGQPILPTIFQLAHSVSQTIEAIDRFVSRSGWTPR